MRDKFKKQFAVIPVLIGTLLLCAAPVFTQNSEAPLTNAAIIKLVRAGFREKTIITIINSRPSRFDLSPDRLVELKRSGVNENVILAMLAAQEGAVEISNDDWGNDPFFTGKRERVSGNNSSDGSNPNEMNIFGSSGGSKDRSKSRMGNGSNEGDSQTTGSATVKIIRPRAEGSNGTAPPKMEKTPTLTNDSVISLVEAGFTEGTIIRRIEQSPADFDLTPSKLGELQRHHVSDRIIAAMRVAMGEDPSDIKNMGTSSDEKSRN
jgi:hypothetical protein